MFARYLLLTVSALAVVPAAHAQQQQSPGGFQLPPDPTPTPTSRVQGPVNPDTGQAPRTTETAAPTPTPSASAPVRQAPTPAATPRATQTGGTQAGTTRTQPTTGAARSPAPNPAQTVPPAIQPTIDPLESAQPGDTPVATPTPTAMPSAALPDTPVPSEVPEPAEAEESWSGWFALLALAVLAIGGIAWLLRRRNAGRPAPTIERPTLRPEPASDTSAAPPISAPVSPIRIEAEALSLSRSFVNTTLSYAITIHNRGPRAIEGVRVSADMTTAHSKVPVDQQLADPATTLPVLTDIEMLQPGAAKQARGEFRLPVNALRTITQGNAHLYVPLLRLRVEAPGMEPVVRTFVVGIRQRGRQSKLLPFRLDEMAQTYREIGLRPLT
ncbi:hypothetical protein [Qipengyuania sp. JC766]|uniref:hypothetical protein n=1 Tax=Qipengyuania sp. JC766 TaxID=3232139 RepID=UPI003457C93A